MDSLYSLIQSLSDHEFELIRKTFRSTADENREKSSKALIYFDFLRNSKRCPEKQSIMQLLYCESNEASFRKLKSRLLARIQDTLTLETYLDSLPESDTMNIISIRLRKKVAQMFFIYATRGNLPILSEIIDSIIRQATEFNVYPVLIETLRFKKSLLYFQTDPKDLKPLNDKIQWYIECDAAKNEANEKYNILIQKGDFRANDNYAEIQDYLVNSITELKTFYDRYPIPSVAYFLKKLEIAYYSNGGNYEEAKNACWELFDLLKNKELFRKERIGMVYDNLGQLEMLTSTFELANSYFTEAQKSFASNSVNMLVSLEQQFLAFFHQGNFVQSEKTLIEIKQQNRESHGKLKASKFQYYEAALLFVQRKFSECHKIIRQSLEISSDKSGWDLYIRFLSIMCGIELKFYDQVSSEILACQRQIERLSKKSSVSLRIKSMSKLLSKVEREGFLWDSLPINEFRDYNDLCGFNKAYCWDPLTPELIPYHEWISSKVKNSHFELIHTRKS